MKYSLKLLFACVFLFTSCLKQKESPFQKYFNPATLRIDYFHTGDAQSESVSLDEMYRYDHWAGSELNLIDPLDYGAYYHKIYDLSSGELIYSRGFDSYFKEYQTSAPALNGEVKQFHESAIVPLPKANVIFALERRDKSGQLQEVFRTEIDPAAALQTVNDLDIHIYTSQESGPSAVKADIAIIGEGYTVEENQKFQDDLKRFTEYFFRAEPCKSNRERFNIRGVLKPSRDSGIDEPRAGIDKNTAVNATFNSMGSERYVLTEDNKSLRDIAGHVPYDALYIMVNSSRYGGGGIYNFYCVYTSDNMDSDYLMVHEFGHSFFGLADEYYTSSTAYNDFYSPDYEPAEPNITALKNPENVKWQDLLSEGIAVPTPWAKAEFDSLDLIWQQERAELNDHIAKLQKERAPDAEVLAAKALYDQKSAARDKDVQQYLESSEFAGKVGAFEGAGYMSTGLYRPSINCIMFTRTDYFCPVCRKAMQEVIDSYSN
jgi:hypothetical protein